MKDDLLSVVIPVFNEAAMISGNVRRVARVLSGAGIPYEIILIDDGSKDASWRELEGCATDMPGVKALKLSRNFGKEAALCAGIDQALGACCVCIDADMQHPPEVIPRMYASWREHGYDVVEGIKTSRGNESLTYKLSAGLFYRLLRKTSGLDLNNASDFRLLDRRAIDAWKSLPEKKTFFRGMSSWIGFSRTQVEFEVADREDGESRWSLFGLIKLAIHGVTSFTAAPLYMSAFAGFCLLVAFFFLLCQTIVMKMLGYAATGFTTVIALQLVIGGMLMMSVGIIGIYIEKIYDEVKARPRYIVRDVAAHQVIQTLDNPLHAGDVKK